MLEDFASTFEKVNGEFLEFKRIKNPPCNRPDLCAFLLLEKLVPGSGDMVCAAEHDEIFLDISADALSKVATEDDIIFLTRCGVLYDSENDSLKMFA